jgi:hypothetical protein
MPRPVPAGTHVAALDRCTFRGLTTGRASVSGHGITAPPAREVPEPSLSMPAHSHRRNTRAAPAGDGCAAAAVALPELDGIRLAILGLHTCRGDTVVHMRASGPMCHAVYGTGRCRCAGSPSSTSLPRLPPTAKDPRASEPAGTALPGRGDLTLPDMPRHVDGAQSPAAGWSQLPFTPVQPPYSRGRLTRTYVVQMT